MDPITGYWVDLAELAALRRLPWGNAGNSVMWHCTFGGQRYVYKEYSEEFRAVADQNALGRLMQWRDTLPDNDRRYLDRVAAWPRYRVRRNGMLLGVMMPYAPPTFFRQMAPDGRHQPNVIASLAGRTMDGIIIAGAAVYVKTSAIGNAAGVLLWFHKHGVLVNDVRELNILCTLDGSAVHYVDCDVMIGPWGRVGPPAAPEYLQQLLPPGAPPSREIELAKLAWVAAWILLDTFSLREIPQARLTSVIHAKDAELIARTGTMQPFDPENWRRLADRWITWTARASVGPPPAGPEVITPQAYLPRTTPMPPRPRQPSRGWVPERFKQPPAPAIPPSTRAPVAEERGAGTIVLVVAVVVFLGLIAVGVLTQGVLR